MRNIIFTITLLIILFQQLAYSQWTNTNCTGTAEIYDMAVINGKLLVARANSRVLNTTDGTTWNNMGAGIAGSYRTIKSFNDTLYTGANATDLFTSTNAASSWTSISGKSGLNSVYLTTIYKNNNVIIYGTSSGSASLYYSTNNGSSWQTSQFDYGTGLQQGFEVGCQDIVELNGVLYFSSYKDLFKSTNNGASWSVVSTAPNIPDGTATSLTTINGGLLLSIYGYGVHKSTDGGLTWALVLGSSSPANNITRVYYEDNMAFAGGAVGQVYQSSDNGNTWTDISGTGITVGDVVKSIKIFNGHLYVGTNTTLYRKSYTPNSISKISLKDNLNIYPNPTSSQLNINITETALSSSRNIIVTLLDTQGKQIIEKSISNHIESMNVEGLSSGIYFLRIASDKEVLTEKVVIE